MQDFLWSAANPIAKVADRTGLFRLALGLLLTGATYSASYAQVPETGEPVCVRNCLSSRSFSKTYAPSAAAYALALGAAEEYLTLQRLNDQASRSDLPEGMKTQIAEKFTKIKGSFVNLQESWMREQHVVEQQDQTNSQEAAALENEGRNLETQKPGQKASDQEIDAYNALANRYNAKIDAYHEDVSRFGKQYIADVTDPRREDGPMEE